MKSSTSAAGVGAGVTVLKGNVIRTFQQVTILMPDVFKPPFHIRSAFAQTLLASSKIRTWGKNPMLDSARELILNPISDDGITAVYQKRWNVKPYHESLKQNASQKNHPLKQRPHR